MKIDNLRKGMGKIGIGNFIKYVSFSMVLIFGVLSIVACGGSGAGGGVVGGGAGNGASPPAPTQPVPGNVFSGGTPIAENPPPPTPPTPGNHVPFISNLTISPSSGPQDTQVTCNITIEDIHADVTKLGVRICSDYQYYYEFDISGQNPLKQNPFDLSFPIIITNVAPGSIPIQVFVKDSVGNVSNYLNTTFTVTGAGALDKINTKEYWPLGDGNEYNYTNGGLIRIAERNFATWITENFFKIDYFINLQFQKSLFHAYDSSDFLLHYGGEFKDKSFYIITPSATQFPKEMEIGKTYYFEYQREEYYENPSGSGIYTLKGLGKEDVQISLTAGPEIVTTGAGTFTAYKVEIVSTWSDSWGAQGVDTEEYWLAKNIGVVKRSTGGVTFELLSATVKGITYP